MHPVSKNNPITVQQYMLTRPSSLRRSSRLAATRIDPQASQKVVPLVAEHISKALLQAAVMPAKPIIIKSQKLAPPVAERIMKALDESENRFIQPQSVMARPSQAQTFVMPPQPIIIKNQKSAVPMPPRAPLQQIGGRIPFQVVPTSVEDVMRLYTNPANQKDGWARVRCSGARLGAALRRHNELFGKDALKYNPMSDFGYVEKLDLDGRTRLFVRADLHGDLKSLLENMRVLQEQGLLDAHYKVTPGSQLILLGDYGDRGDYNMEVLELVTLLKNENPNSVHLIRGNHEEVNLNRACIESGVTQDPNYGAFLDDPHNRRMLDSMYETLPLALYVGEKTPSDRGKQYIQFSHAAIEPTVDLAPLLDTKNRSMAIPRRRKLSDRMMALASFQGTDEDYKKALASARGYKSYNRWMCGIARCLFGKPKSVQALKRQFATKRIKHLTAEWQQRNDELCGYLWGDFGPETHLGPLGRPNGQSAWTLSPTDLKNYFRTASKINSLKLIFHGHQHKFERMLASENKYIGETLTVGMNSLYANFFCQPDIALILTTAQKAEDWKKDTFRCWPGEKTKADHLSKVSEKTFYTPRRPKVS